MSGRGSTKKKNCNKLVLGSHKEDTHKHNHGLLPPGLLDLPHEREAAWEAAQEEPYEQGVEQAEIEE
jgi:hypothetical protein